MIYFDNAATNGFHPSAVTEAAATAVKYLSANPGSTASRSRGRKSSTTRAKKWRAFSAYSIPSG